MTKVTPDDTLHQQVYAAMQRHYDAVVWPPTRLYLGERQMLRLQHDADRTDPRRPEGWQMASYAGCEVYAVKALNHCYVC